MEPLYCILFFNAFSLQLLCSLAKLLHCLNNLYFLFQKYCVPSKNFVCLTSFYILSQKYCVPLRNVEFARSRSGTVLTWDSVAGDKCFQFFRCSQAMCRYCARSVCSSIARTNTEACAVARIISYLNTNETTSMRVRSVSRSGAAALKVIAAK